MRSLPVLFLLAGGLLAQRTWIVRCTAGPGVDFPDLPPAVAAASPGDTILLVPDATCNWYSGAVIDKALRIIGVQAGASIQGLLEVRSIQAGERLLLANLTIRSGYSFPGSPPPHGIHVHDCAGTVHLQNLYYQPSVGNGSVQFVDCANLTMHWCELYAPGWPPSPPPDHSAAILFRRTNATLRECRLHPAVDTDTLSLENSNVIVIDSHIQGPHAYLIFDPLYGFVWMRGGGGAIGQNGGNLTLGPAVIALGGMLPLSYSLDTAIASFNNGSIVQDPTSQDSGCTCPRRQSRIVPAVLMDTVYRNRAFHMSVRGVPGDFALIGLGDYAPPGVSLPTVLGQLLLAPQNLFILAVAQLPASGSLQFTFPMDAGMPMDVVLAFQAGLIHSNWSLELTQAAPFSVLWEPGRIWP